ncbi:MAG: hypothetical protein GKS04_05685 [Candidatus Mycalebacterium zealandia]|nr:MAG: hypothetical protein GKS04_05685 [Candidatus Mycalebacterium zealandia]
MNWIEICLEALLAISQISLAVVAFIGINSWRHEYKEKRQIEIAEETLELFYKVVDVLQSIRNPTVYLDEIKDIERKKEENEKQYKARQKAQVLFDRYDEQIEVFNKIHSLRYRFMAKIGKNKAKPFADLRRIVHKITTSAIILKDLWGLERKPEDKTHWKFVRENENIFWDDRDSNNPTNLEIERIVSEIETTCEKIISGKNNTHSRFGSKATT